MVRNFNSIKVRLKLRGFGEFGRNTVFQFHKGTIKTITGSSSSDIPSISIP